ncbi:riboflavin synthase domain-like protein [Saccharata proteae CBS 121410]|uniref:NADPH--cytochrome P450 reductase n=1 Tax=Saccharata proteae CBS 121410 TaxID=1314787 RepID=A0A9P4I029_9PEZI|nr:riboflavin synthase domain-like protein [Saccharata proteae CBS 121410]
MPTSLLSQPALQEALATLLKTARPNSLADAAALAVVALGSAGYLLKGFTWDRPDPYIYQWYEKPQFRNGAIGNSKKETRNIAQKLEEAHKDLVIFSGSQSGTAEGFANRLAKECHLRFGIETMAADLSDYDAETIALIPRTKLVIFFMSTFGEGDPSDNTAGFWDWLNKKDSITLTNIRYMAFGLGNSNYKYYNRVIDVVVQALDRAGAEALLPVGKADDAVGATEEDFMAWKDQLFTFFKQDLHYEEREIKYEPTISVVEDESLEPIDLHHGEPVHARDNPKAAAACSPIKPLTIQNPRELFTTPDRNCIHMDLDLSEHPEINYKTGDHLAVWPTNPDAEVERLLKALGLSARSEVPISINSLDSTIKVKLPTPTTATALFRYYLEICAPISRDTMIGLAQFAPSPEAKDYLMNLGKDKPAYADFLTRNHLTVGRLLELASPSKAWDALPLSYIVETLPSIQPRYYSISSSSAIQPRKPSITALVSTTPLPAAPTQTIHGLTTNYLLALFQSLTTAQPHPHGLTYHLPGPANALASRKLYAHIRKSKFKLPALGSCPIIMVAAGTGLAPFRAFVAERAKLAAIGKPVGRMLLFFGCRNPTEDYIYREELEDLERALAGKLEIITAFSRVEGGERKVYVQDRVRERKEEVLGLMDEGANFYVCGRAGMAREVGRRVGEEMGVVKGLGGTEVREWSEGLKRRGKWQEDVWG